MFGKKYATPDGLQRALIVSAVAAYGIGVVQIIHLFVQQSFTNPNFSSMWPLLLWQAVPLAFFAFAYFLNPRKKLTALQRVFEAMLITVVGIALFTVVSQLASYLMSLSMMTLTGYDSFLLYQFTVGGAMVVGFAGVLYFLARTKRWK